MSSNLQKSLIGFGGLLAAAGVMYAASQPSPAGLGFMWTSGGVQQAVAASGPDIVLGDAGQTIAQQVTGDGGTNPFGSVGTLPILPGCTVQGIDAGIPEWLWTCNAGGVVSSTGLTTFATLTGGTSASGALNPLPSAGSSSKFWGSIDCVNSGFTAGDANLVDNATWDFAFKVTNGSDGGTLTMLTANNFVGATASSTANGMNAQYGSGGTSGVPTGWAYNVQTSGASLQFQASVASGVTAHCTATINIQVTQ